MPNYANSKVYKLINSVDGRIYIGSTTVSLSTRLANHKSEAKKKPHPVHRHFNSIGWDTVRIVLIETVTCINREQLIQGTTLYRFTEAIIKYIYCLCSLSAWKDTSFLC